MFFHILKRDLKRKKTMNVILFLFIVLASMFMAGSIPNIVTVINGTDYFFDKAGVGDYIVFSHGKASGEAMDELFANNDCWQEHRDDELIFGTGKMLTKDGEDIPVSETCFIQCIERMEYTLFNEDEKDVTPLQPGQCMLKRSLAVDNKLKVGDKLVLNYGGVSVELEYIGYFKDAIFGTPMVGNDRIIISEEDYKKFYENDELNENWLGHAYYIDTDNVSDFQQALFSVPGLVFDADRSMISMCYLMEMITAAVVLVIGAVLIIISFVVLKFMVNFTISEEFREIGVMKAIGIKNAGIRGLYVAKYASFAIVGSVLGLVLSVPFGKLLLDIVTANMVLGNNAGISLNIIGAVIVILVTVAYSYHCTKIIKKSSPIDAIRSGQTGERYKKKKGYRLGKSHFNPSGYLALNDIKSAPKRYFTIIIAFTLCCLLTLIIGNTAATMKSGKMVNQFGMADFDLCFLNSEDSMAIMNDPKTVHSFLDEISKEIGDLGYPNKTYMEMQYKYPVTCKGKDYKLTCQYGINTELSDYQYTKGTAPEKANEIAITKVISKQIDAKIGDTVVFHTPHGDVECVVTAYFESMNNMGTIIRLHNDFETDEINGTGFFPFQVKFLDNPSEKEIENRMKDIEALGYEKVMNAKKFSEDTIGVVDTMEAIENSLLVIMIVIVIFTTILMESSFISNEKGQIAMLKAVGFSEKSIMAWQVTRFGVVSLISVVISIVLSIPATKITITPIFKMLGAETISYTFDYLKVFVIYPLLILVTTVIVTYITALKTKSIKASDTANIE